MNLLESSVQFPTVVFTIGLGITLIYWLFVLLGALDIDLLGGGDVSGAAKGVGDMLIGAKGGAEALKGAGGGDADADADLDSGGVMHWLGLGVVPLTITVSLIMLVCWCGSLLLMSALAPRFGSGGWLPALILLGVILLALPIVGLLVRPLAPIFRVKEGKSSKDYIGHICTIKTGSVHDGFGQATIEDGGSVLDIPVRCDRPEALKRGSKAIIIDFDEVREAYIVEPSADMLADANSSTPT